LRCSSILIAAAAEANRIFIWLVSEDRRFSRINSLVNNKTEGQYLFAVVGKVEAALLLVLR
jgi:hypothetical protein